MSSIADTMTTLPVSFMWPPMLWALLLVPAAVFGYLLLGRRRTLAVARFTNPALLPNLTPRSPGWRRHVPVAFYLLALVGLLISLARPHAVMAVPREQATLVLVMDTSISMVATDVQPSSTACSNTCWNTARSCP